MAPIAPSSNKNGNQNRRKNRNRKRGPRTDRPDMGSSMQVAGSAYAKNLASRFDILPSSKSGSIKVVGQDFLTTLRTPATVVAGQNLATLLINPLDSAFMNTRLQAYGRLYEKYIIKRIRFHYQPAVSASVNGQIVLAYDRDVADSTPGTGTAGIHEYLAMAGSKTMQVWTPGSIDCPLTDTQDFYYTNYSGVGDLRMSHQGQFYVAAVVGVPASTDIGNIWVDYEIVLFDPQLESPIKEAAASGTEVAICTPGETNVWQALAASTKNSRFGLKFFEQNVEALGISTAQSFFDLPGGWYSLTQLMQGVSHAFNWQGLTFVPNISGQSIVENVLASVSPGDPNTPAYKLSNLLVPDGGGRLFQFVNNLGNPTITAELVFAKLVDMAGFELF